MAMNERVDYGKAGLLEVSASQFYNDKLRAHMKEMLMTCKTDYELTRTITSTMNKADGNVNDGRWGEVVEDFSVLMTGISDKNYFNGVMSKAPEEEKSKVRQLITLIDDFFLIIKAEKPADKSEPKLRERLDYHEDEDDPYRGQNGDYSVHNMKNLTTPNPDLRPRIPNR